MYTRIKKDENQSYFIVYEKSQLRPIGNAGLATSITPIGPPNSSS